MVFDILRLMYFYRFQSFFPTPIFWNPPSLYDPLILTSFSIGTDMTPHTLFDEPLLESVVNDWLISFMQRNVVFIYCWFKYVVFTIPAIRNKMNRKIV